MAPNSPLFTAVSSSARQLLLLLRCISTSAKAHVKISPEGLRISTEEGSITESFVFLEKTLFTTYTYNASSPVGPQDDPSDPPVFQISLPSLLETLNIFTLADVTTTGKRDTDAFAAHRLNRHAGINAFSSAALGVVGICTITYAGQGSPLSVHMSESGVTTTCDLTTYDPQAVEEIPFRRDALALKSIMRSSYLLDAVTELFAVNPANLTIEASPSSQAGNELSLTASGALGSAAVNFTTRTASDTPILETFHCPAKTSLSFKFGLIKAAQRAMAAATKVSLRLDEEGVLSMQFLVEVENVAFQGGGGSGVAFVDFRVVPLVDGEVDSDATGSEASSDR